ncbi:MAG: Pvc16 family protein [Jatrophihabitans sp.]
MIAEVDEALCRALGRVLPKGTVVRLDPPKPTWNTEKPSPSVDLFLFAVAGDERGAASGIEDIRGENGRVTARTAPPRRYRLSYLVTARAPKIAEEHQLLDSALQALAGGESLPVSCLPDTLAELGLPVLVDLDAAGPGPLWASLGMPARAAFVLSVSAPHRPDPDTDIAPPADKIALRTDPVERPALGVAGRDAQRARTDIEPDPTAPNNPAAPKRWERVRTDARS